MYTIRNFKTKKELIAAVEAGEIVETFQPGGIFAPVTDGDCFLEGPHYPAPHSWYAQCIVKDGVIQKGTIK